MEEKIRAKRARKEYGRKLAWEMFASYILASLIPIVVIVFFFITRNVRSSKKNLLQMAEPYCERMADTIVMTVSDAEEELNSLKNSDAISKLLFSEYENPADALFAYQRQWGQSARYLVGTDHTVRIYNTVINGNIAPLMNNSLDDFIRIYGEDATGIGNEIRSKILPSYGILPTRIALYSSFGASDRHIYLSVELPLSTILPSLQAGIGLGGYAYLLDGSGSVLGTTDTGGEYVGMISPEFLRSIENSDSARWNGNELLAITRDMTDSSITSECKQWKILYLIPNELFRESLRDNLLDTLPLCVLSVIFSLAVAFAFTRWMTGRMNKLRLKTKRILKADFDIAEPIRTRDELGELEASIYEMAEALETMFRRQYDRLQKENEQKVNNERLLRSAVQAEINALRYQINPHFLFNTMESIRMHLYLKGDKETANVIWQFSSSFRKILDTKEADCSLDDELQTVDSYLQVQKYRLGNRFESEIRVAPEIDRSCVIPKLLLQPLAENAFSHGIELSDQHGLLQIDISLSGSRLNFTVSDNGIGMTEEKLESLRRMLTDPDGSARIGLLNIAKRLKLLFGEEHEFRIESEAGRGTSVFISIPYQCGKKGEQKNESPDR